MLHLKTMCSCCFLTLLQVYFLADIALFIFVGWLVCIIYGITPLVGHFLATECGFYGSRNSDY